MFYARFGVTEELLRYGVPYESSKELHAGPHLTVLVE